MTSKPGLRVTYRQRGQCWEGVVKDGAQVVATCGHTHYNRHQSSVSRGASAVDCAYKLLNEITGDPTAAARLRYPWMETR